MVLSKVQCVYLCYQSKKYSALDWYRCNTAQQCSLVHISEIGRRPSPHLAMLPFFIFSLHCGTEQFLTVLKTATALNVWQCYSGAKNGLSWVHCNTVQGLLALQRTLNSIARLALCSPTEDLVHCLYGLIFSASQGSVLTQREKLENKNKVLLFVFANVSANDCGLWPSFSGLFTMNTNQEKYMQIWL